MKNTVKMITLLCGLSLAAPIVNAGPYKDKNIRHKVNAEIKQMQVKKGKLTDKQIRDIMRNAHPVSCYRSCDSNKK